MILKEVQKMSKSGDSSLHDWFNKSKSSDGKKGWVQLGGKYAGKPCAKQPGQTTKPKCGSSKMKRDLNKDEEEAAFRRKNKKDPNPNRKGKAINVATEETVLEKAGEKDACYKKVKASAKVWPSAYASGRLVQCRKKGAANYGNSKKESYSWRDELDYIQEGAAWTKKEGKKESGGLNEKGRKSYERENPGSDLKAPSKKVGNKRRASFCARMKGMRKRQKPSNNTGDDRLSKSLRAWNC